MICTWAEQISIYGDLIYPIFNIPLGTYVSYPAFLSVGSLIGPVQGPGGGFNDVKQ